MFPSTSNKVMVLLVGSSGEVEVVEVGVDDADMVFGVSISSLLTLDLELV